MAAKHLNERRDSVKGRVRKGSNFGKEKRKYQRPKDDVDGDGDGDGDVRH
jgi:hypothetical protein